MKTYHLSISDLADAVKNAQSESVKSLVIQHNGVNLPVINAAIVPQRNHSDLVLFVGAAQVSPSNDPKTSFLSGFFSKKAKPVPLNKQLHNAFFNALETVLISNGKNPNSFDFATFQEIKSSLAQFSEALENYANSTKSPAKSKNNGFGGAL
jgi:hypothetical protein